MSTRRFAAVTLVLFTVLTAIMTFPQVLHLGDAVHDDGDPLLNAWALSWIAHQLPRAPARLFDANIFYPERRTLAFSEALLAPGVLAAPLHWLGAGSLLVYNLVLLSGFVVSGVGVTLLVRSLTSSSGAAMLAGLVFAFLPFRIDHYPHLQLQQTQWLPFAMWAFHRLLQQGRLRDGVLFGAFTACQALSCVYYGLFLVPYLTVVCGTMLIAGVPNQKFGDRFSGARRPDGKARRPRISGIFEGGATLPAGMPRPENVSEFRIREAGHSRTRERLTALVAAAAIAVVAVFPIGQAYRGARAVVGERRPQEVAEGSATWRSYLAPAEANALYGRAFKRFMQPERQLFPGFVATALAIVGIWPPFSAARIAYALGLLLAFDMSLGFNGFTYRGLYDYVVPFRALRIPARMGILVGFSLAVLAGYGAARALGRLQSVHARRAAVAVVAAVILVEYTSMPIELQPIPPPPQTYADLMRDRGDSPPALILEFPISPGDDATYMYYSTFHWQYLVNGYSGFFPASYVDLVRAMRNFPDVESMTAVKRRGVRYLVIHGERLRGDRYETLIPQLDRRPDLTLVSRHASERAGQHGEVSLYRVLY